jgi:biotin operon repressor
MSDVERILKEMGVGSNDDSWDWFDPDQATAPDRETTPEEARKHRDPEWLHKEYLEKGRSATEIADELGLSRKAIRNAIDQHGLQRESYIHCDTARYRKWYSEAELVEALQVAAENCNGQLTVDKYRYWRRETEPHLPSVNTIIKHLGDRSWSSACERALAELGDE